SGHPTADQPHGYGDEQQRKREQPATLDPLQGPEAAGRLVAGQLHVAGLGEALVEGCRRRLAAPGWWPGADLDEVGGSVPPAVELEFAALGPPLAQHKRRA